MIKQGTGNGAGAFFPTDGNAPGPASATFGYGAAGLVAVRDDWNGA